MSRTLAEDIVIALAATDEPLHDEWTICVLCGSYPHGSECPWARARDYVAAIEAAQGRCPSCGNRAASVFISQCGGADVEE